MRHGVYISLCAPISEYLLLDRKDSSARLGQLASFQSCTILHRRMKGSSHTMSTLMSFSHRQIRALLPEYAASVAFQESITTEYAQIVAHLATCAACRREAAALVAVLQESAAEQIGAAPAYPTFDLPFLRKEQA